MVPWLRSATDRLPDTRRALPAGSDAPGLLAAGGDLTPQRLTEAYSKGVFPWYSEGQPVLWWSPEPRMVLFTDEFRLKRSLRKTIARFVRTPGCEVRIDSAFRRVITACSQTPREGQDGTWIVPEMVEAYCAWHELGQVHSFETWIDGELAGGLYGVSLGRMFFGESMFAHRTDASKIALAALVCFLARASSHLPNSTSVITTAALSKYRCGSPCAHSTRLRPKAALVPSATSRSMLPVPARSAIQPAR